MDYQTRQKYRSFVIRRLMARVIMPVTIFVLLLIIIFGNNNTVNCEALGYVRPPVTEASYDSYLADGVDDEDGEVDDTSSDSDSDVEVEPDEEPDQHNWEQP